MRPPYFKVNALCGHQACDMLAFSVDRKKVDKIGSDGHAYRINKVVCPGCKTWADVVSIEGVE